MRRARAHRAFAHRACAHRVHVLLQLLLSIEPKLAFCMTTDDRTTSRLDAAMGTVLDALDRERKELIRALDKGGVIVVECGGALITAYDFDSFNRY